MEGSLLILAMAFDSGFKKFFGIGSDDVGFKSCMAQKWCLTGGTIFVEGGYFDPSPRCWMQF